MQNSLYETDIHQWSMHQAEQLRRAAERYPDAFETVDIAHVIEEIQDIAVSARQTVQGKLIKAMHLLILLKFEAVADAGEVRSSILHALHDAQDAYLPSMDAFLNLQVLWQKACKRSLKVMKEEGRDLLALPDRLPFSASDVLGENVDIDAVLEKF